eukprot:GHVU01206364.1.p1 GENE.GHVU01206364.1~~GHVU01206364.1.p1  ORF type:complete len:124 (-),score=15.01 GHVU01206364.1:10-381(-)
MSNALSRKCAYYLSLIWHEGISNLDRSQKETIILTVISTVAMLLSNVTIKSEKPGKRKYQPQGGTYYFGVKSNDPSRDNSVSNIAVLGREKDLGPLTNEEEKLLRRLLQKKRTHEEAQAFFNK